MKHTIGATFEQVALFPTDPGAWVGWTARAQVRSQQGTLYEELSCTWLDPATTRNLKLLGYDQSKWRTGPAKFAIRLTRTSDGYTRVTDPVMFDVVQGVVL